MMRGGGYVWRSFRASSAGEREFHVARGINGGSAHARQHQHAADLLANRSQHFHFASSMLMRLAVLHVDYADDPVSRNDWRGQKRLEGVLR